jgi:ppGpp synthetase/RelA/SpoT-type nucleotidyltranferase
MNRRAAANAPNLDEQAKGLAYEAGEVHKWLKGVLESSAASRGVYATKDRVKPWHEIRQKVLAKRNHENVKLRKPNYRVEDVTDASGFRIVCLFNAEIPSTLDKLFALLRAPTEPSARGHFTSKPVKEILFYSSRRVGDPLSIFPEVKRIVGEHGYGSKKIFKAPIIRDEAGNTSSYSSVHVIVESEVGGDANPVRASSEIQLRSVFEEAWGEINHRLNYAPAKRGRALGFGPAGKQPEADESLLHLDSLKSLTDGCAQYADLINAQIVEKLPRETSHDPRSIETAEASFKPFEVCDREVQRAVKKALKFRTKAEGIKPRNPNKPKCFLMASQLFTDAVASLRTSSLPRDADARKKLIDLLRMERAYCQMFSGNPQLRSEAEGTYRETLRNNNENLAALLRLAQIRRAENDFAEARELMEQGLKLAEARGSKQDPAALWVLRRDLAYVYWRIVDLDPKSREAVRLLKSAIKLTDAALKSARNPRNKVNASANLLYYLLELANHMKGAQRSWARTRAKALLQRLRPQVDLDDWTVEKLDTVVRAEREVGSMRRAGRVGATVLKRLQHKMSVAAPTRRDLINAFDLLSRDEKDMYLYAQSAVAEAPRR